MAISGAKKLSTKNAAILFRQVVISELIAIEEDKNLFLEEYGLTESGLNRLIKTSYRILRLITYFTAGVQEVRAWTIQEGWKAPQAAGVIHTDFEKGFIKAEVIKLADYQFYQTCQILFDLFLVLFLSKYHKIYQVQANSHFL